MPIYGYRCKSCDHTFEVMQSVSDEPIEVCPKCEGQVNKLFFPVGISFKGSGFHVNDYKSPKRVAAEKAHSESGCNSSNGSNSECATCATKTFGDN